MLDVFYHFLPEGREGGAQGETADPLGDTLRILHEQITEEISARTGWARSSFHLLSTPLARNWRGEPRSFQHHDLGIGDQAGIIAFWVGAQGNRGTALPALGHQGFVTHVLLRDVRQD